MVCCLKNFGKELTHETYRYRDFVALAFMGCDPVKELDWDRTTKEQRLRIGNQVKFIGITYGLPMYTFKKLITLQLFG